MSKKRNAGGQPPASIYPKRILALDFETTGLVAAYDYIVQIGAAVMEGDAVVDVFQSRVRPNPDKFKITMAALAVQVGDLNAEGAGEKLQEWFSATLEADEAKDVAKAFAAWIAQHNAHTLPVVAHNAAFDHAFYGQFAHQQRKVLTPRLSPIWICTKELAQAKLPGADSYSLDACLLAMGLPSRPGAHDALQDAILAGLLYDKLLALPCPAAAAREAFE